jgi:DNA polymerase-3 subunit epsilon
MEINEQFKDRIVFIDTESTKFIKGGGLKQEGQARVCQIALISCDGVGNILDEYSSIIKPDGWSISEGAYKVHGFTDDHCAEHGFDMKDVIQVYLGYVASATSVVAHGIHFDKQIMDIECAYQGLENPRRSWFCTMVANKHLNNGKYASLAKCYEHYCGEPMPEGAHDAVVDAHALRKIYFAMRGIKL